MEPTVEIVRFVVLTWFAHAYVASFVVVPIVWFTRRRVAWAWADALVFVLPFIAWASLSVTSLMPKSMANLGEVANLSIAIMCAAAIRAIIGRPSTPAVVVAVRSVLIAAVIVVGVATYFLTPPLPETL